MSPVPIHLVPSDRDRAISDRDRIIDTLSELVEALDRRLPHVERAGESHIAREAASLRTQALRRLDELRALAPV